MILLKHIHNVQPSTYNPRKADHHRLELLQLSLQKLGFLLPIYADKNGEILSGHQRHLVAEKMGVTKVPIYYTKALSLNQRMSLNIVFNRATNDTKAHTTTKQMYEQLKGESILEQLKALPDIPLDSEAFYPCLYNCKAVKTKAVLVANSGQTFHYGCQITRALDKRKIKMPLICTNDLVCINGLGRAEYYAENGVEEVDVVFIDNEKAKIAKHLLNLLSMDFDIHTRYKDILRHNAFRRRKGHRKKLGLGMLSIILSNKSAKFFDRKNTKHVDLWKRVYGTNVVDFGAGHLTETKMLEMMGVRSNAFEPFYAPDTDEVDIDASIAINDIFLDKLLTDDPYTTVFLSSVLQSIPFYQDRMYVIAICAALLVGSKGNLIAYTKNIYNCEAQQINGKRMLNKTTINNVGFTLEYEKNVRLADFVKDLPKVQKFYEHRELEQMFRKFFVFVRVRRLNNNVEVIANTPKPMDIAFLKEAIDFEFNLKYADGSRMNLHEKAWKNINQRIKKQTKI